MTALDKMLKDCLRHYQTYLSVTNVKFIVAVKEKSVDHQSHYDLFSYHMFIQNLEEIHQINFQSDFNQSIQQLLRYFSLHQSGRPTQLTQRPYDNSLNITKLVFT